MASLPFGRRPRPGTWIAWQAWQTRQASQIEGAHTGPIPGALPGLWAHAGSGVSGGRRNGGGSRDAAALASGTRQADAAPAAPAPSAMARAQTLLRSHDSVGWFASLLV